MEKNGNLSVLEHSMVVGVVTAGLNISKIADLLGFSHKPSLWFTENPQKKRKYTLCRNFNNDQQFN